MWDWNAVAALAGVAGGVVMVGGAVARVTRTRMDRSDAPRKQKERLDMLQIRLFGLPADPSTGAPKIDGEFDRIDKRLDALPKEIITALKASNA